MDASPWNPFAMLPHVCLHWCDASNPCLWGVFLVLRSRVYARAIGHPHTLKVPDVIIACLSRNAVKHTALQATMLSVLDPTNKGLQIASWR